MCSKFSALLLAFIFLGQPAFAEDLSTSSGLNAPASKESVNVERVLIHPGDKLNIQIYQEPDLSGSFTVDEAGEINYPLLGQIYAQGLSLDELKGFLSERLGAEYLVNPQVKVEFEESPNKSVSILGQVVKPGNYIYTPNLSLIKLVSQVGGFTPNALTNEIKIVRTMNDGAKTTLPIDMDKIIKEASQDFVLEPGDIVYVEKNTQNLMGQIGAGKEDVEGPKAFVTVLGQVASPGNYHHTRDVTLIRVIGQAGGFTPLAATNRVKIVRATDDAKQKVIMVNAGKIMDGRSADVKLEPGDLVTVPESFI